METEVVHLATAEQLTRLCSGDVDLGVIDYAAPAAPVQVQPLYTGERVAAVLPVGHRLTAQPAVRPGDLTRDTLVCSPRTANPAFHDALEAALAVAGHQFRRRRETRGVDPEDVLLAVAQGQGVAVSPLSTLRRAGELGAVLTGRPLDPPVHLPDTMLAWRADPPGALADAICAARAVARELYEFSS
jgi:DNA-binding transcriptional LysR family regulator